MPSPIFEVLALPGMDVGRERLALTVTVIIDGPSGASSFGFELRDHVTGERLALESTGGRPWAEWDAWATAVLTETHADACRLTTPF